MIIRTSHNKDNPYVILNKKVLEIPDLSLKAKGLWAYLMSKPDNWTVRVSHLQKCMKEKRDALRSIINELIRFGLCSFEQPKDEEGKFLQREYVIYEEPILKKCLPKTGFPGPVNAPLLSTENNKEKEIPSNEGTKNPPPKKKFGEYGVEKLTDSQYRKAQKT